MRPFIKYALLVFSFLIISCRPNVYSFDAEGNSNVTISKNLSNSKISGFAEDAKGQIWMATFRGINKYTAPDYYQYFVSDSVGLRSNIISSVYNDSKGVLWFATYKGVVTYENNGRFREVFIQGDELQINDIVETTTGDLYFCATNRLLVANQTADSLFVVDYFNEYSGNSTACAGIDGSIWICQENTIYTYSSGGEILDQVARINGRILSSCMMPNGELWLSADKNVYVFDTTTNQFKSLPSSVQNSNKLRSSSIYQIFLVDNTFVLLCTLKDGIFCYNRKTQELLHESDVDFPIEVPNFRITTVFEDSHGNIWYGSENQGFKVVNKNQNRYNIDKTLSTYFEDIPVISLAYDQSGLLVISTLNNGLYSYNINSKEIKKLDLSELFESQNIEETYFNTIFVDSNNHLWLLSNELKVVFECILNENGLWLLYTVPFNSPVSIVEDKKGGIWIGGTGSDVLFIDSNTDLERVQLYSHSAVIQDMTMVSDSSMVVCSDSEPMVVINTNTRTTYPLVVYLDTPEAVNPLDVNPVTLINNGDGSFAIGTIESGAYEYKISEHRFVSVEATSNMDIYSMIPDDNGIIWLGTNDGIYKYNRMTNVANKLSDETGIQGKSFYLRSVTKIPDGSLVFGGHHGITMFNPLTISGIESRKVVLENLSIQNRLVNPGPKSIITKDMAYTSNIVINYSQNSFSIGFSALNYLEQITPSYSCLLEGVDNHWIELGDNNKVYYSSLPSGKYNLKVKLSSTSPDDEENITSLRIRIKPHPMTSGHAISLYVLIIGASVFGFFYWRRRNRILEMQLAKERYNVEKAEKEMAQHDRDQAKKLNEMQMAYFENVAHEFRTPLTMIAGPMDILSKSENMNKDEKKLLSIVHKSSNWLLLLVNQLLDSSRISDGQVNLKVVKKDVVSIIDYMYETFSFRAKTKKILFTTFGVDDPFEMWIDEDKLKKILINFLSNAFKFTPFGGRVTLGFDVIPREEAVKLFDLDPETADARYAKFSVCDTGKGISEKDLSNIFERFYQVEQIGTGSGIGLYYSRALAQAHGGHIKAWSSTEAGNAGSTFAIILPLSDSFYPEEVREISDNLQTLEFPTVDFSDGPAQSEDEEIDENEDNRPKLVVVDDDVDVANYIKFLFSSTYSVSVFYNATQALQDIEAQHPDIIISDVAMPNMNGYEFCNKIKNDIGTCHIPVILVTAKVTINNQVEGLESGADAYVTKPFDTAYLKALVASMLENRKRMMKNIATVTNEEEIDPSTKLNPQDKFFLKELYAILETELSNPELDVNSISERMKMSRTKLYNKIKDLTGESPSVLFKTYKLNMAAKLLLEGKYNMSEIADKTGFSALSHFSYSFKKQFGVPPSEYKG